MKWYIQGLVFGYLSVPQRTGRLGRGLEMVDGHQERSMQLGLPLVAHSIELAAPLPLLLKVCGFLGLGGALVARTVHRGSIYSGEAPGKAWDRIQIPDPRTGAPPGQLDPQLDRVEFPLLDSIESGGRAGASGLGSLPPSLRVVFSFPWLERRGSVRLLGREPPWSGEKRSTPRECGGLGLLLLA
ncbi:unnamed protein product [Microthlaspi erraticum]|uniref:Uncharacterized protein n=1 Tax=Microthlaspi erraticum TaxID=1685480 RepID=A0A6D2JMJ2_9BRAS|nr:unnamed protein product [Microthlaspi erraticum]